VLHVRPRQALGDGSLQEPTRLGTMFSALLYPFLPRPQVGTYHSRVIQILALFFYVPVLHLGKSWWRDG